MSEPLNEKRIEELYWFFDDKRNKSNRDERDVFKEVMRKFAHEEISRYLRCDTISEARID